jgi:hypothetical protein
MKLRNKKNKRKYFTNFFLINNYFFNNVTVSF